LALRLTPAQTRRCYGLLRSGGDVWAALIELNSFRFRRRAKPLLGYTELCREVAGVEVGELSVAALRSVVRRYSDAALTTARRKRAGERARYPRRRRGLMPLRWYAGRFEIAPGRLRLSVAKGAPPCWLRLARAVPYPPDQLRSVTLLAEAGRLYVDVTAEVPVEVHDLDPARVAGVDPGIIHPYAVAGPEEALLVSGRAVRAEERLHLADTRTRARRMGRKAPRRGQRGSRRWRQLRAAQRGAEARHRRRVHQAHHHAAKAVVAWALARRIGTLVIGDPKGITNRDSGRRQNRRLRQWRRTHLMRALVDKATLAGIAVVLVNERGTSSTCPVCGSVASKPKGRIFECKACGLLAHRDLVGATNIAARGGAFTSVYALVTHRRAGLVPARRDRRRHLMDARRSCPAPGRPGRSSGSRSSGRDLAAERSAAGAPRAA
jgi:putative transposase